MKLRAFTKTCAGRVIVDVPALALEEGKIHAVIGANGSGKTTFARILAGVLPADGGGGVFTEACEVGYMPQKSYAFRMSTRRNIRLGGKDRERAEMLTRRLGLEPLANQRADRLSGGETARLALARTLVRRYDLVILDEPTAAMDIACASAAEEAILQSRKELGGTVLLITHNIRQAWRLADGVLFFHQGRLLESGPAEQVLNHPRRPETAGFLRFYGV